MAAGWQCDFARPSSGYRTTSLAAQERGNNRHGDTVVVFVGEIALTVRIEMEGGVVEELQIDQFDC
jgi:hypothetical protein